MTTKKVTMTDIAKKLGISQATVSIVLNGKGDKRIAPETCKNVMEAAQKMGYKTPQNIGQNFSSSVLYITDDITDSSMAPYLIKGAQAATRENGKNLIILTDLLDHQEDLTRILKQLKPHSVILATSILREIEVDPAVTGYNIILLNCIDKHHNFPSIMPDDRFGAQEATEHLIAGGCQNIVCITGDRWMMATQNRLEGYKQALMTNNINFNPDYIHDAGWNLKKAHDITLKILNKYPNIDGIFGFNDFMSQGIYYALQKTGKNIGKDIKIISFDNHEVTTQLTPPLSSVELPHERMGEVAVEYLIHKQPNLYGSRIVLPCYLKKRKSG